MTSAVLHLPRRILWGIALSAVSASLFAANEYQIELSVDPEMELLPTPGQVLVSRLWPGASRIGTGTGRAPVNSIMER